MGFDFDLLCEKDAVEDRADFAESDLETLSRQFVSDIHDAVETEQRLLLIEAKTANDGYWTAMDAAKDEGEAPSYIGTRARIHRGTLQLEWFKQRVRPDQGPGKPKQTLSTYIKKGKGYRYSSAKFSREPEWARSEIERTEEHYELIRKKAALLSSIKAQLREYQKLQDKCFGLEDDNE